MTTRTTLFLTLLLGLTALAGCIGEDPAGTTTASPTEPAEEDDRSQTSNTSLPTYIPLVRIDNPPQAQEADVACTLGGGPDLGRTADGYVANGTTHLEVLLTNPPTSTGYLQLGYVVDAEGGDHETDVDGEITWLEAVPPGETANRTAEVTPDLIETSPDDRRWDFYARYTTPEAQEEACYTGASIGSSQIHIDAVRGGPG